ncbi:DUF1654 domain-containing protein [Pseudomonas sp. NPDC078700]|uniref:DUF1654 domain-containing protein n=1 Tax=Pseudomonas sp. NPDC078700 TaxID=3364424 RepID=UPI0037C51B22
MAKHRKQDQQALEPMSGVERLRLRVSSMINHPVAQVQRWVKVHRLDTDGDREWNEVLGEVEDSDGIAMEFDDDGAVTLKWEALTDDNYIAEAHEAPEVEIEEPAPF